MIMAYSAYLRKSRADSSQETEEETLSRHETILRNLAATQKLNVTRIYREVVSGEAIAARPQMQELLQDVEAGLWDGVLVVEIERLGRGNSIDQGIISETFRYSNTKIITPLKTFDLNDEYDDEYSEFGLFMSRREYKTINRRLQRGRKLSVSEGKFLGSIAPYGYDRLKLKKGYSLTPNESEAEVVKLIFDLFVNKRLGPSVIANQLNDLKIIPRKQDEWTHQTVRGILSNPVCIGKIRFDYRKTEKRMQNNQITKSRPRNDAYTLTDGLHQPIINEEMFNQAQEIFKNNSVSTPKVKSDMALKNPLAKIVYCGKCGRVMIRRPYKDNTASLICVSKLCSNVGTNIDIVEDKLIQRLESWLKEYKLKFDSPKKVQSDSSLKLKAIYQLEKELEKVDKQINALCDLLEQGTYTIERYQERNKILEDKKNQMIKDIEKLKSTINNTEHVQENIKHYTNIIQLYKGTDNVEVKNKLLKEILAKVEYTKDISGRWGDVNNFKLKLYPRI
jgi:DNA invertase Pin-like site-specific DNA recombinase